MIKILLILLIIILFYIFYFTKKNNEYYSDISQTSSSSIIKDIDIDNKPLVTKSIFEKQNYLIITPKLKNISKLKVKTSQNITFISNQTENNLVKLNEFKNKLKTETISYFIKSQINISKVPSIKYRGLIFDKNTYEEEIDGYMYYLFTLNKEAYLNLQKLQYLNLEQINKIYLKNNKYGDIQIFISGVKTLKTDPIYQIKNSFYLIFYKDNDNITRFQQIEVDLNYFYNILNYEFIKFFINQNLPNSLDGSIINTFYDNIQDNISKNYDKIIFNLNNENIIDNIIINVFENKKKVDVINIFNNIQKHNNKCGFIPSGNTLFECKQLCSTDLNISCSEQQCNNICNNCYSEACKWNYSKKINNEKLRPSKSKIKGFIGNKFIKVTWIKPESKSELIKYYIIVTTPTNKEFIQIYSFYDSRELPEYIIKNLENNKPYIVSLISKNKIGVSDISNLETIVPNENSELDDYENQNTYDNSLQNYFETSKDSIDLNSQKSIYEKQVIINELKYILINKLKINIPIGVYNVNIF